MHIVKPQRQFCKQRENNLCQQIFPLNYIYLSLEPPMADNIVFSKKILIPTTHHSHQTERYQKEPQELKSYIDYKFFIAPNRESRPLGLPFSRGANDASYDQRFQPSFDNFSLSSMFANKTLSEIELGQFKKDRNNRSQIFQTPLRKKMQSIGGRETDQALRTIQTQGKKSRPKQKGLRQLSQRAYEIVLTLRSASYKEVANKLVDELNNEKQISQQIMRIEQKDEQNIKRRVYDALNVLIALGVLRKEGRKIVGDRSIKLKFEQSDRSTLEAEIQFKKNQIAKKKQILRRETIKAQLLPQLINQNRARTEQCNKISFPFMIVDASPRGIVKTELNAEGGYQKLQIRNLVNFNDLMKMDLDCYVDYKVQEGAFRKKN